MSQRGKENTEISERCVDSDDEIIASRRTTSEKSPEEENSHRSSEKSQIPAPTPAKRRHEHQAIVNRSDDDDDDTPIPAAVKRQKPVQDKSKTQKSTGKQLPSAEQRLKKVTDKLKQMADSSGETDEDEEDFLEQALTMVTPYVRSQQIVENIPAAQEGLNRDFGERKQSTKESVLCLFCWLAAGGEGRGISAAVDQYRQENAQRQALGIKETDYWYRRIYEVPSGFGSTQSLVHGVVLDLIVSNQSKSLSSTSDPIQANSAQDSDTGVVFRVDWRFPGQEKHGGQGSFSHAGISDSCRGAFKSIISRILDKSVQDIEIELNSFRNALSGTFLFGFLDNPRDEPQPFDLKALVKDSKKFSQNDLTMDFTKHDERRQELFPLWAAQKKEEKTQEEGEEAAKEPNKVKLSLQAPGLTPREEEIASKATGTFGCRWNRVALFLPGRSTGEVREHMTALQQQASKPPSVGTS